MSKVGGPTGHQIPQAPSNESPVQSSASQATQKTGSQLSTNVTQTAKDSTPEKTIKQDPKGKLAESLIEGQTREAQLRSKLHPSTLERGMKGPEVDKLQDQLVKQGYMTKEQKATGPGIFGPKTEAALRKFQSDHGLVSDGIYGPKTQKALDQASILHPNEGTEKPALEKVKSEPVATQYAGPREIPDSKMKTTRSLEEQAKLYDKYEKLIPPDKFKTGSNEMNIVGLRHHDIGSDKDLRSYDDRFVVLYKDKQGNKHAQVFEGATHTGQKETRGKFTDVNHDGKSDIAYIKPGTYDFHIGQNDKFGTHLRPDRDIAAWRDTNQDGRITGAEKETSFTAGAILFHKGGTSAPRSVGCQTLEPSEYERFIDLIKQDPNGKVSYTLADANR
jgi:peptidoglycan hydrolase-like protein with peptidoglycan-binding domain